MSVVLVLIGCMLVAHGVSALLLRWLIGCTERR